MRRIIAPSILTYNINISSLLSIVVRFFFISIFIIIFSFFFFTVAFSFEKIFTNTIFTYELGSYFIGALIAGGIFYAFYDYYKKITSYYYSLKNKLSKK